MAFIVETGSGTPGANAYASVAFVLAYLTDRQRQAENLWSTGSTAQQQASIVAATDYIETRWGGKFLGTRARTWLDGRAASGTLTLSANPLDTETVTVGSNVYRFVNALAQENDVLIGGNADASLANLALAINSPQGYEDQVYETTFANYEVIASASTGSILFTAQTTGENGNLIALATTITGASVTGASLTEGVDAGPQPLSFPRTNLYTREGILVVGVPLKLKQATAEYSVRAHAAALSPDPTVSASLAPIIKYREKTGPLEEETVYAAGGLPTIIVPYPAADRLLAEYVASSGGASAVRG